MPDITMCLNNDCKVSHKCYRHSKSGTQYSYHQSVCHFKPDNKGECTHYWVREIKNNKENSNGENKERS